MFIICFFKLSHFVNNLRFFSFLSFVNLRNYEFQYPTDPFTALFPWNPPIDVSEVHNFAGQRISRHPNCERAGRVVRETLATTSRKIFYWELVLIGGQIDLRVTKLWVLPFPRCRGWGPRRRSAGRSGSSKRGWVRHTQRWHNSRRHTSQCPRRSLHPGSGAWATLQGLRPSRCLAQYLQLEMEIFVKSNAFLFLFGGILLWSQPLGRNSCLPNQPCWHGNCIMELNQFSVG